MSAPEARVDRVLGAGLFCEIGRPRVAKTSPDGTLIVVGGALVWPQWHSHDVSRRSRPNPGWAFHVFNADLDALQHDRVNADAHRRLGHSVK